MEHDRPPKENPQDQTSYAEEASPGFLLLDKDIPRAHQWCMLMRVEISEQQALQIVSGVSPDASVWNMLNTKSVGPGCKLCGQIFGDSDNCPGITEEGTFLRSFD